MDIDVPLALGAWRVTPAPADLMAASGVVGAAVFGVWGVRPDALNESVALRPFLPDTWPELSLRQLRVGQSLADFLLRRTRNGLALSASRVRGPALRVLLTCEGVEAFEVDGVELTGGRAVFRLERDHQITLRA